MKNDQHKPNAVDFYWDGVSVLRPNAVDLIRKYRHFCTESSLENLANLHWALWRYQHRDNPNEVAEHTLHVHNHGADKYGLRNYLGLTLDRVLNATGRHLYAYISGVVKDESGYLNAAHLWANIYIMAEILTKNGFSIKSIEENGIC